MLWLAWEDDSSIRSSVLAGELGAHYRAFTLFDHSRAFGWLRYPVAAVQTFWTILRMRPHLLVVQNPSILLAFEAAVLRPFFRYRLAIDLHTSFVRVRGVKKLIVDVLHEFGLRHCDVVIVSNEAYQRRVAGLTSKPVAVLPDKIPALSLSGDLERRERSILYICTFSVDEPWREVVAAAKMLPDDVHIFISGRSPLRRDQVPTNIELTGFLPTHTYHGLLQSVDAIMVLTTADENLVCGAYEAVAAGKPLILSETAALRSYFHRGTVFTENHPAAIGEAITNALDRIDELTMAMTTLRRELSISWQSHWAELLLLLGVPPRSAAGPVLSASRTAKAG